MGHDTATVTDKQLVIATIGAMPETATLEQMEAEIARLADARHAPAGGHLTDAQQADLRRRIADDDANPDDLIPWEQVKADALRRLRK